METNNSVKRNQIGFCLLLFAAVFAFFLVTSRKGPVLFDDSGSYIQLSWYEGVMPVYPLFLQLNRYVFGENVYLWAVIVEQAFLAAFSIVLLEEAVRRRMGLHFAEGILLCILALYPYTIEMPAAVMTQAVLTEGIAYSLFYIFFIVLLLAVWEKSYGWLCGAFCMTVILTAIRSQLQMLFGVCGIVFLYLMCMRGEKAGKGQKVIRFLEGAVGCLAISLLGILLAAGIVRGYRAVLLQPYGSLKMFALSVQDPGAYQEALEEEPEEEENLVDRDFSTSQYLTLIFSRGMYEADREDEALFQDEVLRGLYLTLYDAVDIGQERYVYAGEGLWMWKDIVGGIGKIGGTCFMVPSEYYAEHAPEIISAEDFSETRHDHLQTIGLTLIKAHFGRFLYHTLMLLPQAFVSTIFFQYAPLYLFCHLVTLFLYLSALALMIWGYADRKADHRCAEFMALVLGSNVVMVIIISLVFFGQQRYLVYAFGFFYIAYYLLLRQLWCVRLREFLRKKLLPKKRGESV